MKNKLDYNTSKKIKKGKKFTKKSYKNNREVQYAFNKILNTTEAELKQLNLNLSRYEELQREEGYLR